MSDQTGVWRKYKQSRVQHFILQEQGEFVIACRPRRIDSNGDKQIASIDEADLTNAGYLPQCQKCLRKNVF